MAARVADASRMVAAGRLERQERPPTGWLVAKQPKPATPLLEVTEALEAQLPMLEQLYYAHKAMAKRMREEAGDADARERQMGAKIEEQQVELMELRRELDVMKRMVSKGPASLLFA